MASKQLLILILENRSAVTRWIKALDLSKNVQGLDLAKVIGGVRKGIQP